jgi:hypothetical protein
MALLKTGEKSFKHGVLESKVVACVGEIETLVAEGEVGNLLPAQSERQSRPIMEGRVYDLVGREAAKLVGHRHVADLSTPSLHQSDANVPGFQWVYRH